MSGEQMPVGGLGVGGVARRGLGQLGGQECVFGGFRGEFEGFEEFSAGVGRVGLCVEAGEGSPGAGAEGGVTGGEFGGAQEGDVGFVKASGAGEKEAEGDVRLGEGGVIGDGGAVALFGGGGLVEGVLGGAEIVKEAGVFWGGLGEWGEELQGALEVVGFEGGVGLLALG